MRIILKKGYLILCLVVFSLNPSGCQVKKWINFDPIKEELPITMFDRYLLEIYGAVRLTHPQIGIHISFIRNIKDTTNLDTIPVFIIDSLCFYGSCLDSSYCQVPLDNNEFYEYLKKESPDILVLDAGLPLPYKDLRYMHDKIVPINYHLISEYSIPFPTTCMNTTMTVEIRARLLDRLTGKELAREAKTLRFLIEPKEKRIILSQSTIPEKGLELCQGTLAFGKQDLTELKKEVFGNAFNKIYFFIVRSSFYISRL